MSFYYSSVPAVINYTSIQARDLDFEDQEALELQVEEWLMDAKSLIDADRNRDFLEEADGDKEEVPRGIHNIAMRLVSNMVAQAKLRRSTAIVQKSEYNLEFADDSVFTEAIEKDLNRFRRKAERAGGSLRIGIMSTAGFGRKDNV
jgi:hypothetical protein